MNIRLLFIICLSLILSACSSGGGGSDDGTPSATPAGNSARSIGISDFQGSSTSIPSSDIQAAINANSYFTSTSNSEDLGSVEGLDEVQVDDDCLDEKLEAYVIEEQEDGSYVVLIDNTDLRECFNFSIPGVSTRIDSLYASIYSEAIILDEFGNPVTVTGPIYQEAMDEEGSWFVDEALLKLHMHMKFTLSANGDSVTIVVNVKNMVSDVSGDTLPCQFDFATRMIGDCVIRDALSLQVVDQAWEDEFHVETLLFNNIVDSDSGTYYTNGTIDFNIANWQGVMSYHATDTEIAPQYEVSNGFQTLTGTYSPPTISGMSTAISQSIAASKPAISKKLRSLGK